MWNGMRRRFLTTVTLFILFVFTLFISVRVGVAQLPQAGFELPGLSKPATSQPTQGLTVSPSTFCAIQPPRQRTAASIRAEIAQRAATMRAEPITLDRFRQLPTDPLLVKAMNPTAYTPREQITLIDPSNYGERFLKDVNGNPASMEAIVVLHETVGTASSAINFFRTYHPNDADQSSYHTLIKRDGTIVYLVPPDKRAYGAGNSVFFSSKGVEAVKTHPKFPPSVNNFAYHISFESPSDGMNNRANHRGYTAMQYASLAWLVAKTGVPNDRITTHKLVDQSGSRMDPRSFNMSQLLARLNIYPRTSEISIRCTDPTQT
jgi:hypothetical protein